MTAKTKTTAATLAAALLSTASYVAGCQGAGHATIDVPTPMGPAVVDLWWCEEGQCVAATDPADTPEGVPMLAAAVTLETTAKAMTPDP